MPDRPSSSGKGCKPVVRSSSREEKSRKEKSREQKLSAALRANLRRRKHPTSFRTRKSSGC